MAISVNTNKQAMVALQNLNRTNDKLDDVQARISTGMKVGNAKDNAAIYAIAQGQRADVGALNAVKMSLDRAQSISDVTMAAGETISDVLTQIKEKVVAAMDPSLDADSRKALNAHYKSLIGQISQVVKNAEFDGANLLNGSLTTDIKFLANADADQFVTLSVKNMTLGGAIVTLASTSSINTVTNATAVLTALNASISNVNLALADTGAQAKQIEAHSKFVQKLADSLTAGIGNLVDADLSQESARLQALQVQQQLGVQSLSIANQGPQSILSLFRG